MNEVEVARLMALHHSDFDLEMRELIGSDRFDNLSKKALSRKDYLQVLREQGVTVPRSLPRDANTSNGKSASFRDQLDEDDDIPF